MLACSRARVLACALLLCAREADAPFPLQVWVDPNTGDLRLLLRKSDAFDENSQPVTTGALRLRFDPPLWKPPPMPVCNSANPLAGYTNITKPGGSTIGDQAHVLNHTYQCGYQGTNVNYGNCPTTPATVAAVCCEIPGCVAFALGNRTCLENNFGPACALQPGGEAASCKSSSCSFMQLYSSIKADPGPVGPGWRTYVNKHAAITLPAAPPPPAAVKSGPCTADKNFCIELDVPTATVSITTAEYKVKVFVELNAPLRDGKPDRSAGILHVQVEERRLGAPFSLAVTLEPFREEGRKTPLGAAFCDPRFEHADTLASKAGDEDLSWFHWNKLKDSTYQAETMVGQGMGPPTEALPEIFAHRAFGARLAGAGLTAKNSTTLSGSGLSKVDLVATLLTLAPTEAPTGSAWLEAIGTVRPARPGPATAGACHTRAGRASGRACATSWEELMERSYIEVTAASGADASEHLAAKRITDHVSWDRYLSLIQGRAGFGPIKFNGQMFTGASGNFGTHEVNRTWDRRGWGAGYWWQNERPPCVGTHV